MPSNGNVNNNAYKRNIEESKQLLQNIENILRSKGPGSASKKNKNTPKMAEPGPPSPTEPTPTPGPPTKSNNIKQSREPSRPNNITISLPPSKIKKTFEEPSLAPLTTNSSKSKSRSNNTLKVLNQKRKSISLNNNTNINISTSAAKTILNKPNNETKISQAPTKTKKNVSIVKPDEAKTTIAPAKIAITTMEESVPEVKESAIIETQAPTTPVIIPQPKPTLSKETEEKSAFVPQRPRKRGGKRKTRKRRNN